MVGLVIAGPWLTMVGARVSTRRSSRPATLIAARRLADNPQAGFRAISGVVLALFVTSAAVGVITTIVAYRGSSDDGTATNTTLSRTFWREDSVVASVPDAVSTDLPSTPGVQGITVVRRNPAHSAGHMDVLPGLVSCADIARVPALGRCASGATVATVWPGLIGPDTSRGRATIWSAASLSAQDLQRLPILSIVVSTDGSTEAIEHARTVLEVAYPEEPVPPSTRNEIELEFAQTLAGWRRLANVVILASLVIAGCSLAASVAGGLSERKRPFSMLRLTGVQLRVLRRLVAVESAVPLVIAAVVATGTGFLAAQLFLTAQMDYALRPPGAEYYVLVLAGLAASLGIIASTLPLLERITGPETARNE